MVTIFAPACEGLSKKTQTGASAKPATGSRSWSDPVAASEQERAQHVKEFTRRRRGPGAMSSHDAAPEAE
ncbi:hypothetical protein MHIB_37820 [Mycolicibacter hiberniae]|uniref:Uncharacterized protein n=1 Tax=Mycolicibacter hiberniae TaxID=29314 RepID=A0A7I7X722_9MYCO|nr:hypothetical protein MHIB_37820 [Mycolicibacter hiberniae]